MARAHACSELCCLEPFLKTCFQDRALITAAYDDLTTTHDGSDLLIAWTALWGADLGLPTRPNRSPLNLGHPSAEAVTVSKQAGAEGGDASAVSALPPVSTCDLVILQICRARNKPGT